MKYEKYVKQKLHFSDLNKDILLARLYKCFQLHKQLKDIFLWKESRRSDRLLSAAKDSMSDSASSDELALVEEMSSSSSSIAASLV